MIFETIESTGPYTARVRRRGIRARPHARQDIRRYAENVGVDLDGVLNDTEAIRDAITRYDHPLKDTRVGCADTKGKTHT